MASAVTKNNVKYFEAASPERILDYLDEKEKTIEKEKNEVRKIIPDLILRQKASTKSEVRVFMGWEGLKTANEDIINTLKRGEEWLSMGLTEQPEDWEIYFNHKQKERADKGIIQKHLLNVKYQSLHRERKKLAYTELRFLPKGLEMPTSTEIYANKVLIFILNKQNPMAIMIECKDVAESFKKYFQVMWTLAKK